MFEDSVEGFIDRWRRHAVDGVAFARAEGSPLLEVAVGGAVVQLFERTGPYDAPTGPVRLIVHAVASSWTSGSTDDPSLSAVSPARLRIVGTVVEVEGSLAVVDAGVPLVLGLDPLDDAQPLPSVGDRLACESLVPAQAFVVRSSGPRRAADPVDDQV
ncbi:MAG: hypothetical protein K0A98_05025 [Trueperaceae bacterium]|nr:hypothetical protein [Trueperaceae bacterium]